MSKQTDILELAEAFEAAAEVTLDSGDREPGSQLSEKGKRWVIDGLRLLAGKSLRAGASK